MKKILIRYVETYTFLDGLDTTQLKQNIYFVEYWFLWEKCSWKIWKFYLQKTELWYVHVEDSMWKEDAASGEVKGCAWCASELGYVQKEDGWQVRWKLPVEDVFVSTKKLFAAFKLLTELVKNLWSNWRERESVNQSKNVHFLLDLSEDSEAKGSCLNWDVEEKKSKGE